MFAWAVAVPAGFALLEFNGPIWLTRLTLGYALLGAYIEALKLLGWWAKTQAGLARESEDRKMRHHHYHCQRNPEAFERLKRENIERETRDQTLREAAGLKATAAN